MAAWRHENGRKHGLAVSLQGLQALAADTVPQTCRTIFTAREKTVAIRRKGDGGHRSGMAEQGLRNARRDIPKPGCGIRATGQNLATIGRHG